MEQGEENLSWEELHQKYQDLKEEKDELTMQLSSLIRTVARQNLSISVLVTEKGELQDKMSSLQQKLNDHIVANDTADNDPNVIRCYADLTADFIPQELQHMRIDMFDIALNDKVLNKGNFGVVRKAEYNKEIVVFKTLKKRMIRDDKINEIVIMLKISAIPTLDHVVRAIGYVVNPNPHTNMSELALVMPFYPKGNLKDYCFDNSSTISTDEKVRFCLEAARALQILFENGVCHGDVACRNFVLDNALKVYITDFGLAEMRTDGKDNCRYTHKDCPAWIAPEIWTRLEMSEKSDVYGFGICVHEIALGREPWQEGQVEVGCAEDMVLPGNCDPLFKDLIALCWKQEPSERPCFERIINILKDWQLKRQSSEASNSVIEYAV